MRVVEDAKEINLIRIFSDAQSVLRGLRAGRNENLGPLGSSTTTTALEGVYERAGWLRDRGVDVQVVCVEGHAGSEGNVLADQLAGWAAMEQHRRVRVENCNVWNELPRLAMEEDVSTMWKEKGQDWMDEWLWRRNRRVLVRDRLYPEEVRRMEIEISAWGKRRVNDEDDVAEDYENQGKYVVRRLETSVVERAEIIADLKYNLCSTEGMHPDLWYELLYRETEQKKEQF